jgi:hypothetical protein
MKRFALVFILFLGFCVFSQDKSVGNTQVKPEKPSIYLDYVCQSNDKIRLRMLNNTIWTIAVSSDELYYKTKKIVKLSNGKEFYTMPNDKEVSIRYRIEKNALPTKNIKVPEITYADSFFTNWISSDDSILFSVPIKYLKDDLQIFVRFNYEWEVSKNGTILSGPEHRVSFRGIDIPDKLKICE